VSTAKQECDLCGLPVPANGYALQAGERNLAFCCEGCKGIWLMLHGEPDTQPGPAPEREGEHQ
jgi:hypothetical protein